MEISILQEELLEQYFRYKKNIECYEREINQINIKGSIQKKIINGKSYNYLQWRDQDKIKSKYIPEAEKEFYQNRIKLRNSHLESIKRLSISVKQIEKFLGKEMIEEYAKKIRKIILLKF